VPVEVRERQALGCDRQLPAQGRHRSWRRRLRCQQIEHQRAHRPLALRIFAPFGRDQALHFAFGQAHLACRAAGGITQHPEHRVFGGIREEPPAERLDQFQAGVSGHGDQPLQAFDVVGQHRVGGRGGGTPSAAPIRIDRQIRGGFEHTVAGEGPDVHRQRRARRPPRRG
jgi:hypothetical protein